MTDKLRALMAKWRKRQDETSPLSVCCCGTVCADELEALLAEQAPAGESASPKPENVKWLIDASNQVISELGKQEHLDSDTFRWLCNAVGQIERDLRQSSQPAEQRDPAAK